MVAGAGGLAAAAGSRVRPAGLAQLTVPSRQTNHAWVLPPASYCPERRREGWRVDPRQAGGRASRATHFLKAITHGGHNAEEARPDVRCERVRDRQRHLRKPSSPGARHRHLRRPKCAEGGDAEERHAEDHHRRGQRTIRRLAEARSVARLEVQRHRRGRPRRPEGRRRERHPVRQGPGRSKPTS